MGRAVSVESPGTAKNALTVGASRSDRAPSPEAKQPTTFGGWWPSVFPNCRFSTQELSGDAEAMAAISSRGPCFNPTRFKPGPRGAGHLHPLGTKLDRRDAWKVLGAARQRSLRVRWRHEHGRRGRSGLRRTRPSVPDRPAQPTPSAALLKAILINGARWLEGADAVNGNDRPPNFHQGFGRVSVADSIPNQSLRDANWSSVTPGSAGTAGYR